MIGIYKITNTINGKVYIGQSVDINKRLIRHRCNGIKNRHYTPESHLYRAMHKYGIDKFQFEVLEECPESELNRLEMYYIKAYNSTDSEFGYNVTYGGEGGTKVDRERIVELWNDGLTISAISRKCNCVRNTVKGILSEYGIEYKDIARKRWVNQKSRKVSQYALDGEFIKTWNSAREVERELGFDHSGISNCCNYIYSQYGGFKWRYAERSETAAMADLLD